MLLFYLFLIYYFCLSIRLSAITTIINLIYFTSTFNVKYISGEYDFNRIVPLFHKSCQFQSLEVLGRVSEAQIQVGELFN